MLQEWATVRLLRSHLEWVRTMTMKLYKAATKKRPRSEVLSVWFPVGTGLACRRLGYATTSTWFVIDACIYGFPTGVSQLETGKCLLIHDTPIPLSILDNC